MTMITLKSIRKGQQIFNDFGQLPRSDLLRRYGYVTDNYKRWDVVEVDIETVTKAAGEHNTLNRKEKNDRVMFFKQLRLIKDLLTGCSLTLRQSGKFCKMVMILLALRQTRHSNSIELLFLQLPPYCSTLRSSRKLWRTHQSSHRHLYECLWL